MLVCTLFADYLAACKTLAISHFLGSSGQEPLYAADFLLIRTSEDGTNHTFEAVSRDYVRSALEIKECLSGFWQPFSRPP